MQKGGHDGVAPLGTHKDRAARAAQFSGVGPGGGGRPCFACFAMACQAGGRACGNALHRTSPALVRRDGARMGNTNGTRRGGAWERERRHAGVPMFRDQGMYAWGPERGQLET